MIIKNKNRSTLKTPSSLQYKTLYCSINFMKYFCFLLFFLFNLPIIALEDTKIEDGSRSNSFFLDSKHQKNFSLGLGLFNYSSYSYSHRSYSNYTYTKKYKDDFYANGTYNFRNTPYSIILLFNSFEFSSQAGNKKGHIVSYDISSIKIGGKISNKFNPKFVKDWPLINQNIEVYLGAGLSLSELKVNDPVLFPKEKRNTSSFFLLLGGKFKIHKNFPFYLANEFIYNTGKETFKDDFYSLNDGVISTTTIGFEF